MDFMAKEILSSIFTDKKVKAIIQNACDIIETCYQEQYRVDEDKHAIKREIYIENRVAFVEEYVSHIKGEQLLHPKEFKRRYLFSPLKYFHAEMGV